MNYCPLQAGPMRLLIVSCLLGFGMVAGTAGQSSAAENEFKPFLSVSEEVNDNIYQTSSNKQTDYITHVTPGATFHYLTPLWAWDVADTFDYSKYALKRESDQNINNANVKGKITLRDNFMYLEVSDTYQRILLDIAQDVTTQSSLYINQTNQNIATVSPYLLWRLGEKSTLKTGYRYTDIRYFGNGSDQLENGLNHDQFENGAFADFQYEWTSKFSLSAGYDFVQNENSTVSYDTHDVYGGFKYQYADKSSIFGKVGNIWQLFDNGETVSFPFWDAGIIHDLGVALATLETSAQITPNPLSVSTKTTSYTGKLDRTLPRGAVGLSCAYTVYENTQAGVNSTLAGVNNQRKLSFSGNGRYEVWDKLYATLFVTAEHFHQGINSTVALSEQITAPEFHYHLNATGGLSYTFNHDIILSLNYTYETYRNDLNDATGAIEINRGIVKIQKNF